MKQLKAFTLIELLTVIVLSSIIITMAYLAMSNTQSQFRLFENTSNQSLEIYNFKTTFALDIENAQFIKISSNSLLLQEEKNDIIYTFNENEITRKTTYSSTSFGISVIETHALLSNKTTTEGFIDYFALTILSLNDETTLKYNKEYSAKNLMAIQQTN
jgi:prepilin-type N-terminal cleavage/methylation domain-containing protein